MTIGRCNSGTGCGAGASAAEFGVSGLRRSFGSGQLGCGLFGDRDLGHSLDGGRECRVFVGCRKRGRFLFHVHFGGRLRLDGELVGLEFFLDGQLQLDLRLERLVLARLVGVGARSFGLGLGDGLDDGRVFERFVARLFGVANGFELLVGVDALSLERLAQAGRLRQGRRRVGRLERRCCDGRRAVPLAGGAVELVDDVVQRRQRPVDPRLGRERVPADRLPSGIGTVRRLLVVRVGKGSPGMFAVVH